MPIVEPGLLEAARQSIEVLLEFKGQSIILTPTTGSATIHSDRGTRSFSAVPPRAAQLFSLNEIGTDDREQSERDEGLNRKRSLTMTGRYNATVAVGDTFSDASADYVVESVDATSGYKIDCAVTAYLKGAGHGPR